jgi:hypothetical protein
VTAPAAALAEPAVVERQRADSRRGEPLGVQPDHLVLDARERTGEHHCWRRSVDEP